MSAVYSSLETPGAANASRDGLIIEYFYAGYTYDEIISILRLNHNFHIGVRQLNRVLRAQGLRRRNVGVPEEVITTAMEGELQGSGSCLGYRSMARRLLSSHGIVASRQRVSQLLRELDPVGVANRRRHNFSRRTYINKGPNYLIHMDGYDKIKRYGFAIHGAICGRVLWLKAGRTNNNPNVIGSYFMNYVDEIKGVPRCIRMDGGTENVLVEDIQKAFRWDHADDMAGEKSVIRGSSHSNQRIERWWLSGKQGGGQYWIDTFKDMEMGGLLSTSNAVHIECARFSFLMLLQQDLDQVRSEWNQHRVRPYRHGEAPSGKPDIMYYMPALYDTVDYKKPANQTDIDPVKDYCAVPFSLGCDEEYARQFTRILDERRLQMPTKMEEAMALYSTLIAMY